MGPGVPWVVMGIAKTILVELLATTGVVEVYVDSEAFGVTLPDALEGLVRLDLGHDQPIPIRMDLADDVLTATLSFNRQPQEVTVPWYAVRGLKTAEVQVAFTEDDQEPTDLEPTGPRPALRLV